MPEVQYNAKPNPVTIPLLMPAKDAKRFSICTFGFRTTGPTFSQSTNQFSCFSYFFPKYTIVDLCNGKWKFPVLKKQLHFTGIFLRVPSICVATSF
jgi:hypothetical protein